MLCAGNKKRKAAFGIIEESNFDKVRACLKMLGLAVLKQYPCIFLLLLSVRVFCQN